MTRLRAALARRRPTNRGGIVKAFLAGALMFTAVVAVGFAAVGVVSWIYGEYGFHPEANAASWANLTPQYANTATCRRCHKPEYATWEGERHASVTCESCHGPLAEHAATAPVEPPSKPLGIPVPDEALCAICHEQSPAKPIAFAQVDLDEHYSNGVCLGCHDPHSADAVRPPDISHSLARLPACVTCHAPEGLKPVPVGHEETDDLACRSCHKRPTAGQ